MHKSIAGSIVVACICTTACASTVSPGGASDASDATASSDAAGDASNDTQPGASEITCPRDGGPTFAAALSACTGASDCIAVVHGLNCCGAQELVGINRTQQTAYNTPEMQCETLVDYDGCDCVAPAPVAQDGRSVPFGMAALADCVSGTCTTRGP